MDFYITLFLQIVILVICVYLFTKKRCDYLSVKEKYIEEWMEIKRIEDESNILVF